MRQNLAGRDALHVAAAIKTGAGIFLSCDDRLIHFPNSSMKGKALRKYSNAGRVSGRDKSLSSGQGVLAVVKAFDFACYAIIIRNVFGSERRLQHCPAFYWYALLSTLTGVTPNFAPLSGDAKRVRK